MADKKTQPAPAPQQANPSESAEPVAAKPVKFIHEKTPQYRIFHGDGAWGSINSAGNAQIDFFVEHSVTPTSVVQPVKPDGSFTGEQIPYGQTDKDHILVIHEFQCGIVLSLNAAMQVHSILDSYIKTAQQQMANVIAQIKQKT